VMGLSFLFLDEVAHIPAAELLMALD